ncbi:hypothetical protein MSNKSG1_02333 [Marinobacter santoriniensis NKSG1]|uniref:Uncharacterized protein n=1 Tax=Marinobacter santoriniensis NKSG1 TaxID=1288826 RepID=M7CWD8_9GAMM|nr:hypothetical protein [Marinobacter santoriniensis]EMP57419.1 hypothetical protein MSNKSG1_02333 [Marinobacter santoriniensis NKSG1]
MKITRQALYEALWSTPRKELASVWAIDPNTITHASKEQNIPLPKPGHWTLVSMGKSPSQPALTGAPDEIVTLEEKPRKPRKKSASDNPKAQTEKAQTSEPIAASRSESTQTDQRPAKSISETLPTIRKAYKTYSSPKAARDYKYQHVLPGSAAVIRIAVMPEMVERALLLMDTILREFQKNQWKTQIPSDKDRNKNSVFIDEVEILFTITEHRRQERVKSESRWTTWEYRYHSTGTLRFQFGTWSWMHEIKDNKRKKLEERIPEIIKGILEEVARVKRVEIERKNSERIERLESRLSGLVRKALDYNRQCEEGLNRCVAYYEEALRIRRLVEAMRGMDCPEQHSNKRENWLIWLESKADSIDPTKNQASLDFAVPKELIDQVSVMIESDLETYSPLKELDLNSSIEKAVRWIKLQQGLIYK